MNKVIVIRPFTDTHTPSNDHDVAQVKGFIENELNNAHIRTLIEDADFDPNTGVVKLDDAPLVEPPPRTVVFKSGSAALEALKESTGTQEVWRAIGYLSEWNLTFPVVDLYVTHDHTELTAVYKDAEGKRGYTIGAVWNGTSFSFHS
jgi:hypothetical protein